MNKYKRELVAFYTTASIFILGVGALIQDPKYFAFLGFGIAAFGILYLVNKLIYLILGKLFPEETSTIGGLYTHIVSFDCNEQENSEKNS